jgi:hypothetical protein
VISVAEITLGWSTGVLSADWGRDGGAVLNNVYIITDAKMVLLTII